MNITINNFISGLRQTSGHLHPGLVLQGTCLSIWDSGSSGTGWKGLGDGCGNCVDICQDNSCLYLGETGVFSSMVSYWLYWAVLYVHSLFDVYINVLASLSAQNMFVCFFHKKDTQIPLLYCMQIRPNNLLLQNNYCHLICNQLRMT